MHRFYAEEILNGRAALTPEDARHALRVLRLRPGDQVELISNGTRYRAVLGENENLIVGEELPSTEPILQITLYQGLPKADKMDWIVQKAVEIGISRIVPVQMSRCVVRFDSKDLEKKLLRWNRIAREAGKQSGRCRIPEVTAPVTLTELAERSDLPDVCAVPWEETAVGGPRSLLDAHPNPPSLGILIGPEGGIAPEEIRMAAPRFEPITLGPRILRTETAGLAAAAAFLALRGEMEGMV